MKRIYIGNLSFAWGEEEVRELFSAYGKVHKVDLIYDRATGRPRGFGFVEMDPDSADAAIDALNGEEHGGRVLRINEAYAKGRGGDGPDRDSSDPSPVVESPIDDAGGDSDDSNADADMDAAISATFGAGLQSEKEDSSGHSSNRAAIANLIGSWLLRPIFGLLRWLWKGIRSFTGSIVGGLRRLWTGVRGFTGSIVSGLYRLWIMLRRFSGAVKKYAPSISQAPPVQGRWSAPSSRTADPSYTSSASKINAKVVEIVVERLSVNALQVTSESSFIHDLGADALDIVELVMEFEEAFDLTIPDEDSESIRTVGEAVAYIESKVIQLPPVLRVRHIEFGGEKRRAFVFEISGNYPAPVGSSVRVELFFHLFDMGGAKGENIPVHSTSQMYNERLGGKVFQLRIPPEKMSGREKYLGWHQIDRIPLAHIRFPKKGQRSILLRMTALSVEKGPNSFRSGERFSSPPSHCQVVTHKFHHSVLSSGYLDDLSDRRHRRGDGADPSKTVPDPVDPSKLAPGFKAWCLSVELAIHVAYADGAVAQAERETIQGWVKKKLASIGSSLIQKATKKQINVSNTHSQTKARNGEIDLSSICTSLREYSEVERLQALTLCIDVAKADKKATTAEFTVLNKINKELDLPGARYSQYRDWINKWILELGVKGIRPIHPRSLLDVTFGVVPRKERKTRLTRAAAFWNGLMADDREEVRKLAEKMMEIIGGWRDGLGD